jgi:hypothetical protein
MRGTEATRIVLVAFGVLSLWAAFATLGYLVTIALHLRQSLGRQFYIRSVGLLAILSSLLLFVWLIKFRKPVEILSSTHVIFSKL